VKQQAYTSDLLTRLMNEAPKDTDLEWLLGHLQKKGSFGLLLAHPRNRHSRPRLGHCRKHSYRFPRGRNDARPRSADATELSHQTGHCHAALHEMVRPSSSCREGRRAGEPVALAHTPLGATKRAVDLLVLLLVISGIWPLPLINVLQAATTALLAIALLQEDGLFLAVSFVVGILSLLVFGYLVWKSAGALGSLLGGLLHLP
jgi:hypothetical protein